MTDFQDSKGNPVAHYEDGINSTFQETGKKESRHYNLVAQDIKGGLNLTALVAEGEKLNNANPDLQPHEGAGGIGTETHCNLAAQNILSSVRSALPEMEKIDGLANDMQGKLSGSKFFKETSSAEARSQAFGGNLVLASWVNPNGTHGHIAPLSVGNALLKGGEVANVGARNGFMSVRDAFGSVPTSAIKYFSFIPGR